MSPAIVCRVRREIEALLAERDREASVGDSAIAAAPGPVATTGELPEVSGAELNAILAE